MFRSWSVFQICACASSIKRLAFYVFIGAILSNSAFAAPPAVPTNLKATASDLYEVNLSWQYTGAGLTGFEIERQIGANRPEIICRVSASIRSFQDKVPSIISNNKTLTYRVRSINATEYSAFSLAAVVTWSQRVNARRNITPQAPVNLKAVGVSASEINLTWTLTSTCQTSIRVERSKYYTGPFITVATIPGNSVSYKDGGLDMETSYYYRVVACGPGSYSSASKFILGKTLGLPPTAASNLNAIAAGDGSLPSGQGGAEILLYWEDTASNDNGFIIERSTSPNSGFVEIGRAGENEETYTDYVSNTSTQYYYRVAAFNKYGKSPYIFASVNWRPIANAGGPKTTTAGQDVTLDGSGSVDPFGAIVSYRWSFGDGTADYNGTGAPTAITHRYVSAGKYTATLTVRDAGGLTATDSAIITVSAPPPPPPPNTNPTEVDLQVVSVKYNRIDFSWNQPENAFFTYLERSSSASGPFSVIKAVSPPTVTASDTTVQPNTTYYYRARVFKTIGGAYISDIEVVQTPSSVNEPPVANAGPDKRAKSNEAITFDASASSDSEGLPLTYAWDFGDGTSATGKTVTKSYSSVGKYTVTLTVTDAGGLTATDTAVVSIDPTLQTVGWIPDLGSSVSDVAVVGNYAYAASKEFGLVVIDISNPAVPRVVGSQHPAGGANQVAVSGNIAIVTGTPRGTDIIDISNKEFPVVLASLPNASRGVCIVGNYAYYNDGKINVIDISNPSNPVKVGQYVPSNGVAGFNVADGKLYVTTGYTTTAKLEIVNVSVPSAMYKVGEVALGSYPTAVDAGNGFAYVCNYDKLQVINVTNPASPVLTATINVGCALDVKYLQGGYVCVAASTFGAKIFNVSNPYDPREVSNPFTGNIYATGIASAGSYLYISSNEYGIKVANISDPANAYEIGTFKSLNSCLGIAAEGQYVYGSDKVSSLVISKVF